MIPKVNRKKTRKLLFQELYAMCFNNFEKESFYESFFNEIFSFSKDEVYLEEMVKVITYNEKQYIKIIETYSPRFKVSKMNINYIIPIYIALGEMFHFSDEIPAKVSVNEAIELAKIYGDDSARKIVNGVLDKVLMDHEKLEKTILSEKSDINYSIFKYTA